MQRTGLVLLKLLVQMFAVIPFRCLYVLSSCLSFLFFKLIKYRLVVVMANLRNSFPEKEDVEIKLLANCFYRHFSDILLESIKGLSLSKVELQRRFHYTNPEIFDELYLQQKSAILLGSHYGNWEWGVLSFPLSVQHRVVGIFKPLKNRLMDAYLNQRRSRWGLHLASMGQAGRVVVDHRHQPCIFVLIADQTPSNIRDAHWVRFLNQDTPFLHGPEKLARSTGYPVFTFEINRCGRGYYEVTFKLMCEKVDKLPHGEMTSLFARQLESQIKKDPPNWLWSHRRWKRKRPEKQP